MMPFTSFKKTKRIRSILCGVVFSLLCLPGFARVDYQQHNGEWQALIQVQKGEGLGQIIRDVGVDPNWQNRSWITDIKNANPNLVSDKGHILHSGQQLTIPIIALRNCNRYQDLLARLQPPKPQPLPDPPLEAAVVVQEPAAQPIEQPIEPTPEEPEKSNSGTAYSFALWAGAGVGYLDGEDSFANKTELTSNFLGVVGGRFFIHFSEIIDLIFSIRGTSIIYPQIEYITSSIEKEFYTSGGMEFNVRLSQRVRLGLFTEYRQAPRTDYNVISLDVKSVPLTTAGLSTAIRILRFEESSLDLQLRPHTILEAKKNNISLDSGFGVTTRLEFTPTQPRLQSGWMLGLEYLLEKQSSTHLILNTADQTTNQFFIYSGYQF